MNRSEQEWHDQELDRGVVEDDGEDEPSDPPGITSPSPERDARIDDLLLAYTECERYAAKMELALQRMKVLCRVGIRASASTGLSHEETVALLHLIGQLTEVKDDRSRIFTEAAHASKQG